VVYEISMRSDEERSTLMPIGIAKAQFGDWDIRPGGHSPVNPRVTFDAERQRVAQNWGGYDLFPYVRRTSDGKIMADTRKIAPPKVPYVSIQEVDQRGNPTGDVLDLWEYYKWENAVDKQAVAEARRRMADEGIQMPGTVNLPAGNIDPAELDKLINAAVEKRMAGQKKAINAP